MQGQSCQDRCTLLQVQLSELQARCMAAEAQNSKLQHTVLRLREEAERREEYIRGLEEGRKLMEREIGLKEAELKTVKREKSLSTAVFDTPTALLELNIQPHPHIPYSHKDLIYASARKSVATRKRSLSAHSLPQRYGSRSKAPITVQYTPSHGRILRKVRKPDFTGHINVPRKSEIRGCLTARGP